MSRAPCNLLPSFCHLPINSSTFPRFQLSAAVVVIGILQNEGSLHEMIASFIFFRTLLMPQVNLQKELRLKS